jgi:hypothetical protein
MDCMPVMTLSFVILLMVASSSTSALVLAAMVSLNSVCCCQGRKSTGTSQSYQSMCLTITTENRTLAMVGSFAAVRKSSGVSQQRSQHLACLPDMISCVRRDLSIDDKETLLWLSCVRHCMLRCTCSLHLHMNAVHGPGRASLGHLRCGVMASMSASPS